MELSIDASVDFAHDRDEAITRLDANPPYDLLLVDLWMPDAQGVLDKEAGLKILKHSKGQHPAPQAIVITANSSAETVLEASGLGIYDYISKPINYTRLVEMTKEILSQRPHDILQSANSPPGDDYEIIGNSDAMIEVMKKVGRIAASDADVLIYGESGTGKEFVARAIHKHSHRRHKPFVPVNCSALPSELIESELFGIGKRVATAVDQQPGKFLQANGGTIFLDEMGDLNLAMQPKLLRVLDSKEIQGIGMNVKQVDVRVIAATNRDLREAVASGEFRSDLYYRLKLMITLPPLRERIDDIPLLAWHFLRKHARTPEQQRICGFDEGFLSVLKRYHWPGNVRELEKAIEYAVVLCTNNLISVNDLPFEIFSPPKVETTHVQRSGATSLTGSVYPQHSMGDGESLEAKLRSLLDVETIKDASQGFEKIFLECKLKQNHWNIQATAQQIGIKRQSLHRKINELGLQRHPNDT